MLEKTLETPLDCKEIKPVHSEGDQPWDFFGSIESAMPSSHLILCRPLLLLPPNPLSIRVFSNEKTLFFSTRVFTSVGQSIGVSASTSVLPVNIHGILGVTGLISLQSKGVSRVFSNTTVQKHQFFGTQLSLPLGPSNILRGASGCPPCHPAPLLVHTSFTTPT